MEQITVVVVVVVVVDSSHFSLNEFAGAHLLGSLLKRATGDVKDSEGNCDYNRGFICMVPELY